MQVGLCVVLCRHGSPLEAPVRCSSRDRASIRMPLSGTSTTFRPARIYGTLVICWFTSGESSVLKMLTGSRTGLPLAEGRRKSEGQAALAHDWETGVEPKVSSKVLSRNYA